MSSAVTGSVVWTEFDTREPYFIDNLSNITYVTSFGQYVVSKDSGSIQYVWINGSILSPSTRFVLQYLQSADSWEDFNLSKPVFIGIYDGSCQWRQKVLNGSERHGYVVINVVFSESSPPKISLSYDKPASSDFTFRVTFKVSIPQAWSYFIDGDEFVSIPKGKALSMLRKELRIVENPESSALQLIVDWSDYGQTEVLLKGSTITVVFGVGERQIDPTVYGSTERLATGVTHQRHLHYVNSRYWAFFVATTNTGVFMSSSDGSVWENYTSIGSVSNDGKALSTWSNSTHLAYVRCFSNTYFRLGTPESNGSITWADSEQLVSTETMTYPDISLDSNSCPFIVAMDWTITDYNVTMFKSDWSNGTWSMTSGYPKVLAQFTTPVYSSLLSLTSTKMYVLYSYTAEELYGRLFNGTDWESNVTATTDAITFSAVSISDVVHVVYTNTAGELKYQTWSGSWSSATTLETGTDTEQVTLTKDGSKLFAIWSDDTDKIYVKALLAGSWTTSMLWTSQSDMILRSLGSMYEKVGSKAGAIWTVGTPSIYTVIFQQFDYTDTVSDFTIYNTDSALPVVSASWDENTQRLTFKSTGNLTVDVGLKGEPFTIYDGTAFVGWTQTGSNISFTATDSEIELAWQYNPQTKVTGGDVEEVEDTIIDITEPVISPLGQLGLYLLIGGMAVVGVVGIAQANTRRKVMRKPTGKVKELSIRASGKGTQKTIRTKELRRKKNKWD